MMKEIWVLVPVLLLLPPVVCGQAADMVTETFVHYTQMKSWMDAQAFCRQYNSDMISVRDNQDNQNFHPVPGWLGLHRLDFRSPWKWSKGDEMANITYWAFGEPSLLNNCAYKDANSLVWKTHGCTVLHTYSCYNEVLILVKENKTWEEALHHCRSLQAVDPSRPATENNNNLYDLVTLITEDDHVNTRKKIQDATTDKVWTGLRFLAGEWLWVNGATVQYDDIQSCPAEGFCGILVKNSTAQFGISDCKQRMNFVCYRTSLPYSLV